MADRKDILVSEVALIAASGTQIGRPIRVAGCDELSVSLVVSVTANTLQATFALGGSNDDVRAADYGATLPALTTGTTSTLLTGVTYSGTTGLVTFNNPAIGTYEVVITYSAFPRTVRPLWTFTSGGGTVSAAATICAWSS